MNDLSEFTAVMNYKTGPTDLVKATRTADKLMALASSHEAAAYRYRSAASLLHSTLLSPMPAFRRSCLTIKEG